MRLPALATALLLFSLQARAAVITPEPPVLPDSVVDLRTPAALTLLSGQWRYHDAQITNNEISPKASAPTFDDASWEKIPADSLEKRRAAGKIALAWYRLQITLPDKLGNTNTAGSTAILEIVANDYAEISIDGKLPTILGQTSPTIKGFNAPNRVILTSNAKPGQTYQIAILALTGPLSNLAPDDGVWIRSATLDVYKPGKIFAPEIVQSTIDRVDPKINDIIPQDAKVERIAGGFKSIEGPIWHPDGYLLFSDPNNNLIYRWTPPGLLSIYRTKSGYTGLDIGEYSQPGSNGLTLDPQGRLTICEQGNRRITRLEKDGTLTVLADKFEGKRLNSPNDLVYRSDGALYFTDPPFGLPRYANDRRRELTTTGVYCLIKGELKLVSTDFTGPNGLAFSPDEKFLYVADWDTAKKIVNRYGVHPDGTLDKPELFYDMTSTPGNEALDGMKVDKQGNVYLSAPLGVRILSPEGKHLGTIKTPELPANMNWGDPDGKTLYMAARTSLYRIRLNIEGIRSTGN